MRGSENGKIRNLVAARQCHCRNARNCFNSTGSTECSRPPRPLCALWTRAVNVWLLGQFALHDRLTVHQPQRHGMVSIFIRSTRLLLGLEEHQLPAEVAALLDSIGRLELQKGCPCSTRLNTADEALAPAAMKRHWLLNGVRILIDPLRFVRPGLRLHVACVDGLHLWARTPRLGVKMQKPNFPTA